MNGYIGGITTAFILMCEVGDNSLPPLFGCIRKQVHDDLWEAITWNSKTKKQVSRPFDQHSGTYTAQDLDFAWSSFIHFLASQNTSKGRSHKGQLPILNKKQNTQLQKGLWLTQVPTWSHCSLSLIYWQICVCKLKPDRKNEKPLWVFIKKVGRWKGQNPNSGSNSYVRRTQFHSHSN